MQRLKVAYDNGLRERLPQSVSGIEPAFPSAIHRRPLYFQHIGRHLSRRFTSGGIVQRSARHTAAHLEVPIMIRSLWYVNSMRIKSDPPDGVILNSLTDLAEAARGVFARKLKSERIKMLIRLSAEADRCGEIIAASADPKAVQDAENQLYGVLLLEISLLGTDLEKAGVA
jgi:hypothetical protein